PEDSPPVGEITKKRRLLTSRSACRPDPGEEHRAQEEGERVGRDRPSRTDRGHHDACNDGTEHRASPAPYTNASRTSSQTVAVLVTRIDAVTDCAASRTRSEPTRIPFPRSRC